MSELLPRQDCLCYSSPAKGGWSIIRTSLLVPESHQLMVGAPSCMRHVIISCTTLGLGHRISGLYPEESDIVSGSYEELILQGASELLQRLEPKPKVLMIFVTCMDDFLGTDHAAFLEPLNRRFPETRSIICHMNPIMADSGLPPGVSIQDNMYSLLTPSALREKWVNFIGNNIDLPAENGLVRHLSEHGFSTSHLSRLRKFSEFEGMAKAALNLVLSPAALYAAERMKQRLGIDYLNLTPSYSLEAIGQQMAAVCAALDIPAPDMSLLEEQVHRRLSALREALQGRAVVIDHAATHSPFSLARLLLEHGVEAPVIYASECPAREKEHAAWVMQRGVQIIPPERFVPAPERRKNNNVCIGFEAAYREGSPHVLTISADGGLWGWHGVMSLADQLEQAASCAMPLQEVIDENVLVV
jgi:hypothetical protein